MSGVARCRMRHGRRTEAVLFYASQCHPPVFKKASRMRIVAWHPMIDGIGNIIGTARLLWRRRHNRDGLVVNLCAKSDAKESFCCQRVVRYPMA
jgi:hypothetical protein